MGNLFEDLPVPTSDGVGASVNVKNFGIEKTITIAPNGDAVMIVEASIDNTNFFPVLSSTAATSITKNFAAQSMRVRINNAQPSFTGGNCDVGGDDSGTAAGVLDVPVVPGVGSPLDVSSFGGFTSVSCGGTFTGTVILEASQDNVNYAPVLAFSQPDFENIENLVAKFVRVRRPTGSGTPVVSIAAANPFAAPGVRQTVRERLTTDFSTTVVAPSWDTLLTEDIATNGGPINILATATLRASATVAVLGRVIIDGNPVGLNGATLGFNFPFPLIIAGVEPVAAGLHTVEFQLAKEPGGGLPIDVFVRAATQSLFESASLVVQEVES